MKKLLLALLIVEASFAATLTHGPLVGHTTDASTRIWVRADGPAKQRPMYLAYRADPYFRALAVTTPVYAIWDAQPTTTGETLTLDDLRFPPARP